MTLPTVPILPGVSAETVTSKRLTTRVLFAGPDDGTPVLLLHGNTSSATWWEEVMLTLPPGFRAIAPDQRGFGAADFEAKIDATRGMGDLADDAIALLDHLGIEQAHVIGHSLGGSVIWRLLVDSPERFLSATVVDPGSPYGFGGTKDVDGTPCYDDYAGSGGGLSNPELLKRLGEQDLSLESQFSPRSALRSLLVKPPFVPEREDDLVLSMVTIHLGERDNPGGFVPSPNWPYAAPGVWGAANALSPKYLVDVELLITTSPKVDLLWIRGSDDLVVADQAVSCPGTLGAMGLIPNWPGPDIYPPQPMVSQTQAVLERYEAAGGRVREGVIENTGHSPYIEDLETFNGIWHPFIEG
jgi:pimeloyl-ACP methyl ester carboxylesterase